MDQQTLLTVMTVFVCVAAIALAIQAAMLYGMYRAARGMQETVGRVVPQAANRDAFPTSFFVGRDGRVRAVHAGFPSPGSGEFYKEAEKEVTTLVEKLLAERAPGTSR